jgi:hypothetical protein
MGQQKEENENKGVELINSIDYFRGLRIYERSIRYHDDCCFFVMKEGSEKFLILIGDTEALSRSGFKGAVMEHESQTFLKCPLSHENAEQLRSSFTFTKPELIGKVNSYGLGDRLGNAGAAHLRAIRNSGFKPVLAQQSIRELERTRRSGEDVLDAASWAVFQEGYTDGFGADADHLKTTDDIDRMVKAGFTMFTIDPGDYVVNEALTMMKDDLLNSYKGLPWRDLNSDPGEGLSHYCKPVSLHNGFSLNPAKEEVMRGMVKYGGVMVHTKRMANYLEETYPDHPAEFELSVDETDQPTTPFEHYLIASELNRLGVKLVSLAPRFYGDFEKGIDFKGDLEAFRKDYEQHLAIAEQFGGYKLSIHSGSDKFSVYEAIGSIRSGAVHVKTAGTSYLEALRTIAQADPGLFREILNFSLKRFDEDKRTYHISANPELIPDPDRVSDSDLPAYLNDNHARQVLHVAYGSVLAETGAEKSGFKKRLMRSLSEHEEIYEKNLTEHFIKHIKPFDL